MALEPVWTVTPLSHTPTPQKKASARNWTLSLVALQPVWTLWCPCHPKETLPLPGTETSFPKSPSPQPNHYTRSTIMTLYHIQRFENCASYDTINLNPLRTCQRAQTFQLLSSPWEWLMKKMSSPAVFYWAIKSSSRLTELYVQNGTKVSWHPMFNKLPQVSSDFCTILYNKHSGLFISQKLKEPQWNIQSYASTKKVQTISSPDILISIHYITKYNQLYKFTSERPSSSTTQKYST